MVIDQFMHAFPGVSGDEHEDSLSSRLMILLTCVRLRVYRRSRVPVIYVGIILTFYTTVPCLIL